MTPGTEFEISRPTLAWVLTCHLLFAAGIPVLRLTAGDHPPVSEIMVGVLVAGVALTAQWQQSVRCLHGRGPANRLWTLAVLGVMTLFPVPAVWQYSQFAVGWFFVASAAMVLRGWLAFLVVCVPLARAVAYEIRASLDYGLTAVHAVGWASYSAVVIIMGGAAIYGSVRLASRLAELSAARDALAKSAVHQERLRISRDLHDLLGNSLSTVALEGELALKLLVRDRDAAVRALDSLIGVARQAGRDVRSVVYDERRTTLSGEVDRAVNLLTAAGVRTTVEIMPDDLDASTAAVLGWAVREGVTNVLRHSTATQCRVTATREGDMTRLSIVNDGASSATGGGIGLSGLQERARSLSGQARGQLRDDGWFELCVEVPGELP